MALGAISNSLSSCSENTGPLGPSSDLADPVIFSSATAIAKAIRTQKVTSEEITKLFLERIDLVNPKINAVVHLDRDKVLAAARKADQSLAKGEELGVLHGVPMTIKDSFDTAGLLSTAGTPGRASFIPDTDAAVVHRLKKAGAILIGKTNTSELTLSYKTDNPIYGLTNNPYNLNHSPGGSSGGAAAIVSAGGSAFDIGTDTGGSIRVPANNCGLCGLKPTTGRVARTGHIISFNAFHQALTTVGPLSRHVEDLITILPLIAGSDGVDPFIYDIPVGNPLQVKIEKLSFAFFSDNGISTPIKEVKELIEGVAKELANTGVVMEEKRPPEAEKTIDLFLNTLMFADKYYTINKIYLEAGSEATPVEAYEEPTISPKQFGEFFQDWSSFQSKLTTHFHQADILLCPVSSTAAPAHSVEGNLLDVYSYNLPFSLAGWPVAVVRVGTSSAGLPIGIQIVGKPWQEDKVLAVAKFIETKFGGFVPPVI